TTRVHRVVGNWDDPGSVCMVWPFVMVLSSWAFHNKHKGSEAKGYSALTTACRTLLWRSSGSGCRGLRPSKRRGNAGRQLSPWSCLPIKRTLCRVANAPAHLWDPCLRYRDDRESSETRPPLPHTGVRQ